MPKTVREYTPRKIADLALGSVGLSNAQLARILPNVTPRDVILEAIYLVEEYPGSPDTRQKAIEVLKARFPEQASI